MKKTIHFLDQINERVGVLVSWLTVFMIILISLDVILRYSFQFTFIWMVELEIYFFGFLFLLASGYTFKHGKHVRVDVFYAKLSAKGKAWVDIFGTAFLLIPWCYVVIVSSWHYGLSSFIANEGSAQPGGLPALYILKFCITVGFSFLFLQGLASLLKSLQILLNRPN